MTNHGSPGLLHLIFSIVDGFNYSYNIPLEKLRGLSLRQLVSLFADLPTNPPTADRSARAESLRQENTRTVLAAIEKLHLQYQ